MYYIGIISTTFLAAAAASVIPAPFQVDPLSKRGQPTVWDPNGNIKLTFSSEIINIGGLKIEDIFASMVAICHESGQCETNDIELDSMLMTASTATALKITLGPTGTYPTWIRNGLIDTLAAATKTVAKCTGGVYTNTCPGVTAMAYCPRKKTEFINCEVPQYWGINYQSANAMEAAPPGMGLDLKAEVKGSNGACEDALTALGAVAGAVHGVGGGVFTLFTFMCS